jgi:death on curing protein
MNYLTIDEVYAIHQRMIKIGGGRWDVHDFTLLHSAVERPKVTFGGRDLYPTIYDKSTALIHSLIKNHPFDDGNKRTAYYSTKRFFYINGYILNANINEVIKFTVSIDVQNLPKEKISLWLKSHCVKI